MRRSPFVVLAVTVACLVGCAAETTDEETSAQTGAELQEAKVQCTFSLEDGIMWGFAESSRDRMQRWVEDHVSKECYAKTKNASGVWTTTFSGRHASSYVVRGPSDGKFNRCIMRALETEERTMRPELNSREPCYMRFTFAPR